MWSSWSWRWSWKWIFKIYPNCVVYSQFLEDIKVARFSPPEELQYFSQDSEVHRGILHTKPGSILPVAGQETSVVKICVFFFRKLPIKRVVLACFSSPGHRFGRQFVDVKPTDALHLLI